MLGGIIRGIRCTYLIVIIRGRKEARIVGKAPKYQKALNMIELSLLFLPPE